MAKFMLFGLCLSYILILGKAIEMIKDLQMASGITTLINGEATFSDIIAHSNNIIKTLSTVQHVDPQVLIGITGLKVIAQEINTVSWQVSCEPADSAHLDYKFTFAQENIKFYYFVVSYLIFEKDANRRVLQGQTNYQSLMDPAQPELGVRISMPFPDKQGYQKYAQVFITGVKLTKSVVHEMVEFEAYVEQQANNTYDIQFFLVDLTGQMTVDVIYYNVIEYYYQTDQLVSSLENELADGFYYNYDSDSDMSASNQPFDEELSPMVFVGTKRLKTLSTDVAQPGGFTLVPTWNTISSPLRLSNWMYRKTRIYKLFFESFKILIQNTGCSQTQYFIQNTCKDSRDDFTYCNSLRVCQSCNSQALNCLYCGSDLSLCETCAPSYYLIQGKCSSTPPENVACDPNTQNCTSDQASPNESFISEDQIQKTSSAFSDLSISSVYVSLTLTLTSGFMKSSGSPFLTQILTLQKTFYLLLINANPPKFLNEFVISLSNKGVLKQFSSFNALSGIASDSSESNTIGDKFETQNIPSDIFINSGGGLTTVTALAAAFILFYVLEKSRFHKIGMLLFEKVACGIIVESFQISVLIFTFSSCICFTNSSEIDAIQIIAILVCFAYIALTLVGQTILLWKARDNTTTDLTQTVVKRSIVQKLLNKSKKDKQQSRLYMSIFITFECFIFPCIIVLARSKGVTAAFLMATAQLLETTATSVIRPFVQTRETVFLIIEQVLFSGIFVSFAILTLLLDQLEESVSPTYPTSVNALSLIITILIISAVLLTPFTKLFRIIVILKDLIRARMQKAKEQVLEEKSTQIQPDTQISKKSQVYPSTSTTVQESVMQVQAIDILPSPIPETSSFHNLGNGNGDRSFLIKIHSSVSPTPRIIEQP